MNAPSRDIPSVDDRGGWAGFTALALARGDVERVLLQESPRAHDHPRRAESALQPVHLAEAGSISEACGKNSSLAPMPLTAGSILQPHGCWTIESSSDSSRYWSGKQRQHGTRLTITGGAGRLCERGCGRARRCVDRRNEVKITGGWDVTVAPRQGFPGSGIADAAHDYPRRAILYRRVIGRVSVSARPPRKSFRFCIALR
jgi:hypothetical protein